MQIKRKKLEEKREKWRGEACIARKNDCATRIHSIDMIRRQQLEISIHACVNLLRNGDGNNGTTKSTEISMAMAMAMALAMVHTHMEQNKTNEKNLEVEKERTKRRAQKR